MFLSLSLISKATLTIAAAQRLLLDQNPVVLGPLLLIPPGSAGQGQGH